MVMNFRILPVSLLLLLLTGAHSPSDVGSQEPFVLAIDPGHGGKDLGWNTDGLAEKDIILDLALMMRELNTRRDLKVVLLREGDVYMGLKERAERIAEIAPDRVLSLHLDSRGRADHPNQFGFISQPNDRAGAEAAVRLAASVERFGPVSTKTSDQFYALKHYPASAILVEIGSVSQAEGRARLSDPAYREKLARALLEAI